MKVKELLDKVKQGKHVTAHLRGRALTKEEASFVFEGFDILSDLIIAVLERAR